MIVDISKEKKINDELVKVGVEFGQTGGRGFGRGARPMGRAIMPKVLLTQLNNGERPYINLPGAKGK